MLPFCLTTFNLTMAMCIHVREPMSYGDRWDMFQCKQLLRLEVQIVDFLATEY